ncbi:MAG: hypothetical protein FWE92_06410, partial [Defluviitaleaceae bacterium]|nr:hypothetical protein [Defluviitaleaceae bacterium]
MIVELDINFSEMEKSILRKYGNLYGDIDIKLFIQTDKLIHIGVRDGKAYDTIIENPRRMLTVG